MCFVAQGVDGVYDVVVGVKTEGCGGRGVVYLTECLDVGCGVDVKESLAQYFDFGLSDGLGGGWLLTVDSAGTDHVAIDEGEVADAGGDQCLGTPRTDASYSEEYDANGGEPLKGFIA